MCQGIMSHKQINDTIKECLFSFQDVTVSVEDNTIIYPMNCDVPFVGGVAIVGSSGSGKTTVLRALLGLVAHTGAIHIMGQYIEESLNNTAIYQRIGVLFQKAGLFNDLTVEENCIIAQELSLLGRSCPDLIEYYLSKLNLWHARHLLPWQLSGGMQHRAGLARALVRQAEYLILDEPTTGQDDENAHIIQNILIDYQKDNKGKLIIVSHDHQWLKPLVQWSILMHEGHMAYSGPLLKALKATQEVVE